MWGGAGGNRDSLLQKLDADGAYVWDFHVAGPASEHAQVVAIGGPTDRIYAAGEKEVRGATGSELVLDADTTLPSTGTSSADNDAYLFRLGR